ncbi:MAG: MFS transporter [Acidimicrobiia bacterium]
MTVPAPRARLGSLVVVLCAVNAIVAADFLGASVLLDPIGRDLHMSTATLAWVVNGYLLTLAAPLIAFGRLADTLGAVRLTRWGLVAFALGALAAGTAGTEEALVAGRMLQGLGASVLTATGLSLVSTSAPDARRGRVVGLWAGVGAIGSAAGPLLAGSLEALGSWRLFFLVDVPFALVVLWFLRAASDAPRGTDGARDRVDLVAVPALILGLGAVVFALLAGPDAGWDSMSVVGGSTLGVGLLGVFVLRERDATRPLIDVHLFANARYSRVAAAAFVGNAAFAVVAFFTSLYLQQVHGLDPVAAGAVFLAMTIPLIGLSPLVGGWATPARRPPLMGAGLVVVAASIAIYAALPVAGGLAIVVVALVVAGVGQAVVFNVSNIAAVGADPTRAGVESGVINELRQIGALVGLAGIGALFAELQRSGTGSASSVFVDALRVPSLLLAAVCLVSAGFVVSGRRRTPVS